MPIDSKDWLSEAELIDFLIKMEREEQKRREREANERPFIQLPIPELPPEANNPEKKDNKKDSDGVIIIDL